MTAKERRELQRLRNENEELASQLERHMRIYSDNLFELVRYKVALKDINGLLVDAVVIANMELNQ